jgi:chorismate mutase/prephenate dehydrogenase
MIDSNAKVTNRNDSNSGSVPETLRVLRDRIVEVDRAILDFLQQRMELAEKVGRIKIAAGEPLFVPDVYEQVLARARSHADACGVSEDVMEAIYVAVMQGSIERQYRAGLAVRPFSNLGDVPLLL